MREICSSYLSSRSSRALAFWIHTPAERSCEHAGEQARERLRSRPVWATPADLLARTLFEGKSPQALHRRWFEPYAICSSDRAGTAAWRSRAQT
jgi:hypothetical protein